MNFNGEFPGSHVGSLLVDKDAEVDGDLTVKGTVNFSTSCSMDTIYTKDGTEALPSHSFIDQKGTGLSRTSLGEVLVSTHGVKRSRVSDTDAEYYVPSKFPSLMSPQYNFPTFTGPTQPSSFTYNTSTQTIDCTVEGSTNLFLNAQGLRGTILSGTRYQFDPLPATTYLQSDLLGTSVALTVADVTSTTFHSSGLVASTAVFSTSLEAGPTTILPTSSTTTTTTNMLDVLDGDMSVAGPDTSYTHNAYAQGGSWWAVREGYGATQTLKTDGSLVIRQSLGSVVADDKLDMNQTLLLDNKGNLTIPGSISASNVTPVVSAWYDALMGSYNGNFTTAQLIFPISPPTTSSNIAINFGTSALEPVYAGWYVITMSSICSASIAGTVRQIFINVDGTQVGFNQTNRTTGTAPVTLCATCVTYVPASGSIQFRALCDAPNPATFSGGYLKIRYIGP